jgi:competence protein ComEA
MGPGSDQPDAAKQRGVIDWTLTPAKWGAVGVLALAGCMGLAWSVIRGEGRNAAALERARLAAVDGEGSAGVPGGLPAGEPGGGDLPGVTVADGDGPGPLAVAPPELAAEDEVAGPVPFAAVETATPRVAGGSPDADPGPASNQDPPAPAADPTIAQRININTATEAELQVLPGIGPSRAAAIVEDRRLNGPFRSVDELDRVRGIGPGIIGGLREFARVR